MVVLMQAWNKQENGLINVENCYIDILESSGLLVIFLDETFQITYISNKFIDLINPDYIPVNRKFYEFVAENEL